MILVSTNFPEEIPWFKASRRAGVAAMFAGGVINCVHQEVHLYEAAKLSAPSDVPKRGNMTCRHLGPDTWKVWRSPLGQVCTANPEWAPDSSHRAVSS